MKVCHFSKKFSSQNKLILKIQLSIELSQTQGILSNYSEVFLFFAKYNFLFENDSLETESSKSKHAPVESTLSSQDPARDGNNWYGYAGQNPVTYKDPTGLAYYGPDGVHSSSEAPTPHGETNKNVTPSVPDTSAMPQNLNILLVPIDDAEAIDKAVNAYFRGLKDGVAGNAPVDGIGLVDMNGNTIHIFTNDESISKFNEALGYNAEPNWTNADYASEIESLVDNAGMIISLADIGKVPNMSKGSTVLGVISLVIDVQKVKINPTAGNKIDAALDAIGLAGVVAGPEVSLLSIYLSCVKTEVEIWAQTMAEGTVEFNNRAKQYQYEKMMEEMERYEQ